MKLPRNAWVYFAALILGMTLLSWQLELRRRQLQQADRSDTQRREIHGFDLSVCLIPVADIVKCGASRDELATLDFPRYLDSAGLDSLNAEGHSAFLLPRDLVMGVAWDGQARAYPLSILDWHELVNDTLAGRAVIVSWHPLSGSAAAYSRALDGREPIFGFSGLLYNSNALIYDRSGDDGGTASLFSQLTGRALIGPAAADSLYLTRLPSELTRWDDWRGRHPETLVLAPDAAGLARKYRRQPYNSYYGNDLLQYPVRPLPPGKDLALKTPVLSVWAPERQHLYPFPLIAERCDPKGIWTLNQEGNLMRLHYQADPPSVTVTAEAGTIISSQAFWFAWYSQEQDADSLRLRDSRP